jgi:response regulator RpfG family c-di-GMP phosphodiesterase
LLVIFSHIPIIAVTAFSLKGDRERFISSGMDEYISKPIKIEELQQLINTVLIRDNGSADFNEIPVINSNGEVEFIPYTATKPNKDLKATITGIDMLLNELVILAMNNSYMEVEDIIHSIKEHLGKIDAGELKDAAFKIELSARKGKYQTLREDTNHLIFQFETLKKELQHKGE